MKTTRILSLTLLCMLTLHISAQQVNTLYFLENAPMRHVFNPAFQPISNGYVNFSPLGYTSLRVGNNALTLSDFVYTRDGRTITALHPDGDKAALLRTIRKSTFVNADISTELVGFGFRIKENGYFHFNAIERIEMGATLPKDAFRFALDGGMTDLTGVNSFNLGGLSADMQAYTELGFGYSHKINEQWTVGGKFKFLLGSAYVGLQQKNWTLDASATQWNIQGNGYLQMAGPVNWSELPQHMDPNFFSDRDVKDLFDTRVGSILKPSGYGAAFDLGMTYKPIEWAEINASITDLGFLCWTNARSYNTSIDTIYTGSREYEYSEYMKDNQFKSDSLISDALGQLKDLLYAHSAEYEKDKFTRFLSMKLNVGVDFKLWENRVDLGILSRTKVYNQHVYEELTLGAALRPCNWFNFALSYSLVENGKYSNFGAGISFMPYDGVNMTIAMDYIPTTYASSKGILIPDGASNINLALGFSVVWGTNKKKTKEEPVLENLDQWPTYELDTVTGEVIELDSDGDGVPDAVDRCPDTPEEARAYVDIYGCVPDSDMDGVPDYKDECNDTPREAIGFVDEKGCPRDLDGDGVPDYLDECPSIPGVKENKGCPEIKKEVRQLLQKAMQGIQFETGNAVIKKSSYPILDEIAATFVANPTYIIEVQGHTDNQGKAGVNKRLSQKRADAVRDYLMVQGVEGERLIAKGYGDECPIADNKTKEGRSLNRRVEFKISFVEISYEVIYDHADPQPESESTTQE